MWPQASHTVEWQLSLLIIPKVDDWNWAFRSPLGSSTRYPANQILALQFLTVAKSQAWSTNKVILWLGLPTTWGTVFKGGNIRKTENHGSNALVLSCRAFAIWEPLVLTEVLGKVWCCTFGGRGENAAENHTGKSRSQHPRGERHKRSQSHEAQTGAHGSVSSFSYLLL